METDFTRAIREILKQGFPDYKPSHIEKVANEIFLWTGRVDYRLRYFDMCERDMEGYDEYIKSLKEDEEKTNSA